METFVQLIDVNKNDKLLHYLEEQGFTVSHPAHTHFSGKKPGLSVTLFQSQKCVVQGKGAQEFIEFFFEPEILESFEATTLREGFLPHIGVDESGKGDFFGPLVVAGVQADEKGLEHLLSIGVKDSKTLSDSVIHSLATKIKARCPFQIVILNPQKYNEVYASFKNLNSLLGWGHATILEALYNKTGCDHAIIDQFASEHVVLQALKRKKLKLNLTQRTKGESDPIVAAASILARDAFVTEMDRLSKEVGILLPKGASAQVKEAARRLIREQGRDVLPNYVKLHFKTLDTL